MSRARRLTIAVAAVGMLISAAAGAQEYPTKPITLIVPWPAGGSTDISMRAIAESASKLLGQPIAIDNKTTMWQQYFNRYWPSIYLFDKEGIARWGWSGELNWKGAKGDVYLREKLEELLRE